MFSQSRDSQTNISNHSCVLLSDTNNIGCAGGVDIQIPSFNGGTLTREQVNIESVDKLWTYLVQFILLNR